MSRRSSKLTCSRILAVSCLPSLRMTLPLSSLTSLFAVRPSSRAAKELRTPFFRLLSSSSMSRLMRSISFFSISRVRSSLSTPLREKTLASMTTPSMPGGTRREESLTSPAFSPKMARSSFSSGESMLSPLGVTLPTSMSPALTSAPMRTMPESSRLRSPSSPTLGMSRVISSLPSLVSRAMVSKISMCTEVKVSSLRSRSFTRMESSKL